MYRSQRVQKVLEENNVRASSTICRNKDRSETEDNDKQEEIGSFFKKTKSTDSLAQNYGVLRT